MHFIRTYKLVLLLLAAAVFGSFTIAGLGAKVAEAGPLGTGGSWAPGMDFPTATGAVRLVGVYFAANGKFYAMGGRSDDTAGDDFMHPFEYDLPTNTWAT